MCDEVDKVLWLDLKKVRNKLCNQSMFYATTPQSCDVVEFYNSGSLYDYGNTK